MKNLVLRHLGALLCPLILGLTPWIAVAADTEVPGSAEEVRPLLVGAQVPDVTLSNTEGKPVQLRQSVAEKPSVLIFYRGGW